MPDLTQSNQTAHRQNILNGWNIVPGSNIIEVGCGQGDCTIVLASVASSGHIDAIDPAPLDYGSPETLGEAQARILASDIGSRISFDQSGPIEFLKSVTDGAYDVAVFVHSSWYFSSPDELKKTFAMLRGKAKRLCVAEYALSASERAAMPHVLAALARASLERYNPGSKANIRNAFSIHVLKRMARESGWALAGEKMVVPDEGLEDGKWEVGSVVHEGFLIEVFENVEDERVRILLESMREAVKAAVSNLGEDEKVRTMDVWTGVFQ